MEVTTTALPQHLGLAASKKYAQGDIAGTQSLAAHSLPGKPDKVY